MNDLKAELSRIYWEKVGKVSTEPHIERSDAPEGAAEMNLHSRDLDRLPSREEAEDALALLRRWASDVSAVLTGHSAKGPPPDLKPNRQAEPKGPEKVPGVNHLIAIASGKGGVGKSTVSANLACALAAEGRRVGLLGISQGKHQPCLLNPDEPGGVQPSVGYSIWPLPAIGHKPLRGKHEADAPSKE